MKKILSASAALLLLSGCATPVMTTVMGVPETETPPQSKIDTILANISEAGNLVIVREYAEPTAWPANVFINGDKLASLGQKQYLVTRLEPGTHELKISWPVMSGQTTANTQVNIVEGETHYIGLLGSSSASSFGGGTQFEMSAGFVKLSTETTPTALAYCCEMKALD